MNKNTAREGDESSYGRAAPTNADDLVANRAKVISVLRKAQEFVENDNPRDPQRALELAAGRVGVKPEEYRALVDGDTELAELEQVFLRRQ